MPDAVTRRIDLPVPPSEVWDAVATPERLGAWFGGDIDLQPVPGAPFSFEADDGGYRFGVTTEVVPGQSLEFWWTDETGADNSSVRIELRPDGGGTLVEVTETLAEVATEPINVAAARPVGFRPSALAKVG